MKKIAVLVLLAALFSGCSLDATKIWYVVEAQSAGGIGLASQVEYIDEAGATIQLTNVALPWTVILIHRPAAAQIHLSSPDAVNLKIVDSVNFAVVRGTGSIVYDIQ